MISPDELATKRISAIDLNVRPLVFQACVGISNRAAGGRNSCSWETNGQRHFASDRVAVGGFSGGAFYALSSRHHGDLFTHVIAFSPGFMAPTRQQGNPRLFISHGIRNKVLPIDRCSRKLVPQLTRAGYDVLYQEFYGPHTVPSNIAYEAIEWFTGKR